MHIIDFNNHEIENNDKIARIVGYYPTIGDVIKYLTENQENLEKHSLSIKVETKRNA